MIVTFGEWLLARGSGLARVPVAAERCQGCWPGECQDCKLGESALDAAVRERDEARELCDALRAERARTLRKRREGMEREKARIRERDEARAERDERNLTIRQLRAEVERLRRERDEAGRSCTFVAGGGPRAIERRFLSGGDDA